MSKDKIVEKHVTIEETIFNKLRIIAKREDRTMRAVLHRLINEKFNKEK